MNDLNTVQEGLTSQQVIENRKFFGENTEKIHDFTTAKIILKTLFSVFNIIIFCLIVILLLVGESSAAKFIGVVAAINTLIQLVQEIRSRFIVKKLNKLSEKIVKVIRDCQEKEMRMQELVIGDIIHLKSGDRVPVDGKLIYSEYAEFDESILTGESKYIQKQIGEEIKAGSFLSAGSCVYQMTKFTRDSYLQMLTREVSKQGIVESPLQSQINEIIKVLTYMTIFFIILIVAEGMIEENQLREIVINASTLVSSMVPQGLVLITTVSFAYGAMKIAKNQAIVQRLSSIESMANVKVVCMDKTGTLTKNILEVKEVKWL